MWHNPYLKWDSGRILQNMEQNIFKSLYNQDIRQYKFQVTGKKYTAYSGDFLQLLDEHLRFQLKDEYDI